MQDLFTSKKCERQFKVDVKMNNNVINIISSDDEKDKLLSNNKKYGKQSKIYDTLV